jgi:hypothetical protein
MWLPGSLIRFGERAAFLFGVACIVYRAAVIEQLKQTQEMLAKLLALLEAGAQPSVPRTFISPAGRYRGIMRGLRY